MDEQITLLRSINSHLETLLALYASGGKSGAAAPADVNLDGPYGDPTIKAKDPNDWTGESMKGRRFSECPAEYLEILAKRYDYFATKETDPKKARYNTLDGARARAWAKRIRAGYVPAAAAESFGDDAGIFGGVEDYGEGF